MSAQVLAEIAENAPRWGDRDLREWAVGIVTYAADALRETEFTLADAAHETPGFRAMLLRRHLTALAIQAVRAAALIDAEFSEAIAAIEESRYDDPDERASARATVMARVGA